MMRQQLLNMQQQQVSPIKHNLESPDEKKRSKKANEKKKSPDLLSTKETSTGALPIGLSTSTAM